MAKESVVVMGLPASGKTTFLAALWHLLSAKKITSKLTLVRLKAVEGEHLRTIATRWLQAKKQDRTFHSKNRTAVLSLRTEDGKEFDLAFPDIAGEAFASIWEARECDAELVDALRAPGVMLFIHSSAYRRPHWIADIDKLSSKIGSTRVAEELIPWEARLAPTQVQLVDLLRCLQEAPLHVGPRRLAVIMSAWDHAEEEGMTPENYLRAHMPMLHQYLMHGLDNLWTIRVYGVSAQGGDYDGDGKETSVEAMRLQDMEVPSHRFKVAYETETSNDLSEPLIWLLKRGDQ